MNKMLITTAGLAEIVNAEQSGTAPVVLSHVAFGTGQYTATADLTALKSEFKRFDAVAGGAISDNMIHLTVHDNSTDKYTVNEVGVFTASGTLFAVISQTTPIMEKSATSESMLAIDVALTDIDASSITFGDTNLVLNPATTATAGIVELATADEAKSGTDTTRAMTPAAAKAARDADANIVHRTGNETIAGVKTFTTFIKQESKEVDLTVIPTTEQRLFGMVGYDKNGKTYTAVETRQLADNGTAYTQLYTRNVKEDGTDVSGSIGLYVKKDGTTYATAPTPPAGDNSTKIATTAWANAKFLPLAGGTMSGEIKVNSDVITAGLTDDRAYHFNGGKTWTTGSYLVLTGNDSPRVGRFVLGTGGGETAPVLLGDPSGVLSWQDKNIVRSVNGKNADTAGNANITATDVDALPRSGGAMTATKAIYRDVNDSYLGLHGGTGTDNDGAQLDLCGSEHPSMPGVFQLHARTPDKDVILRGMTDGKLTWGDKYVLTNSYVATVDNGAVMLTAGTQSVKGAYLRLYGADHSTGAGTFAIAASDGTTSKSLTGNADGTLTWGGRNIVTKTNPGNLFLFAGESTGDFCGSLRLYKLDMAGSNQIVFHLGVSGADLVGYDTGDLMWNDMRVSAMSMPSETYTDLTLGATGTSYTAPADGWYYVRKTVGSSSTSQWLTITNTTTGISSSNALAYGGSLELYLPVKAHDKVKVSYDASGTTSAFKFIYAEGAKHLA